MSKSPLVAFAVIALAAGCVAVSGPTAAPSASPNASPTTGTTTPHPATATPSAAPTGSVAPTAPTTVAPTASAESSASPAPSASIVPTAQPSGDLGFDQRDLIFYDDLTDPNSGWGVGTTEGGSVAYANGALQFNTTASGAWIWSRRLAGTPSATMRVVGDFFPTGSGRFGLMCLSGDTQLYGAVVGTDGSWAFVTIGDNGAQTLLGDASAGLPVKAGASNPVTVECTGTATGALRMSLVLGNSGVIATYTQAGGPANFDRAAAYVDAADVGFSVNLDTAVLFGSRIGDGSLSSSGQQLLAHVPTDWQSSCYQGLVPPYLATTAEAVLTCFLPSHDGAEIAEYAAYSTTNSMNTTYQSRIDAFGKGDGVTSCKTGSGEHAYNFGSGTPDVGRLLCVPQFAGIRFDWTDTRLNILSTLIDFDGSYSSTFTDWGIAGPNL